LEGPYDNHLVQPPDQFRADQKLRNVIKALSKHLLNTDRLGASTMSLGSLFQGLTTLSIKKCVTMSNLNVQSKKKKRKKKYFG